MIHSRVVWRVVVRLLGIGLLVFVGSNLAHAQSTAALTGRVQDSSGSAVPGVAVTVTSQETGATRTATTDESGSYQVLSLGVGHYSIKAEKSGFKSVTQTGINLAVGQQGVVNLTLEVGAVQQEVTVTAEAQLINTTTASIAGLVNEQAVKDLPLNGRSFDNLLTLNPGAVARTTSKNPVGNGQQTGNLFSVAGRRVDENLFLLNGVEYTGPSLAHSVPGGVSGQLLGIDAVREFNSVEDTYGAQYGKVAGSQIGIVTQSGTNSLHGTVIEFLRNSVLNAQNDFSGGTRPPFKRNQFGGALGGPIQKDKTFIFGNYEGFRQRLGESIVTLVPSAEARLGMINGVAVPGFDPRMTGFMNAFWPAPSPGLENTPGGGIGKTISNPNQSIREDFGTVRVDHSFSNNDQLAGVYTIDDGISITPQTDPLFDQDIALRSHVLSLSETHIFSPTTINTFTTGFSRASQYFTTPPVDSSAFPSQYIFVSGALPGRASVGGSGSGNTSTITLAGGAIETLSIPTRNLFTYEDTLEKTKGKHQLSFGVWFQRVQSNERDNAPQSGTAAFTSLTTLLQGITSSFTASPNITPMYWRQWEGAWFVQDNIQVRPNLSIRLGLRDEFNNGWNERYGHASNFFYDSTAHMLDTAPIVGSSIFTQNNATKLLSPRIGIAWDPFGKGKTSVRAGFGTYYDTLGVLGYHVDGNPPFAGTASFSNVSVFSVFPINPLIPLAPQCGPTVVGTCTIYRAQNIQTNAKTPTIEEWNLTVEQQLGANTSLSIGYVGSHGFHLMTTQDNNSIAPQVCGLAAGCSAGGVLTAAQKGAALVTVPQGTTYIPAQASGAAAARPNQYLNTAQCWCTTADSSYNALQVQLIQRISAGLQFKANYTYSKNLDDGSSLITGDAVNTPGSIANAYNPLTDYGISANNFTHQFSFSGSYELPFGKGKHWGGGVSGVTDKLVSGWQVNTIVTLLSGIPFTLTTGANSSGNGDTNNIDRPNLTPGYTSVQVSGTIPTSCGAVTPSPQHPSGFLFPAGTPLGTPTNWYNPCALTLATPGTFGNEPRNFVTGPNYREVDLSLFKTTTITERLKAEFRVETFNLFNHPNFNTPSLAAFSGSGYSTAAGNITSAADPRELQFGLKLIF